MTPSDPLSTAEPRICPRCGSTVSASLSGGSVCLRCAGERALGEATGSGTVPPPDGGGDIPTRIGPYDIIEELGRGGMGRVYAAQQAGLGRIVALKAVAVGPGYPTELEMRFLRETQTVAALRHPNIVAIHDSGRAGGHVYFSMEYIEGGDLAARIRNGPLPPAIAAAMIRKIADALAYAHGHGVLHRDIKPSNILLDGEEPKLADFGLAAQLEAGWDLTAATGVLGTPHYLAPEAFKGGSAALGVASDVYALGVVLFAALTGRTPYAGASPAELPTLLFDSDPPSPRLLAPAVPRDLETICMKCLERYPERRYASADALADDLRRYLEGQPVLAQPPGALYLFHKFALRHRAAIGSATAIAVILVAGTIVSSWLAVRATRAEKRASTAAATSKEVIDFIQNDLLGQASPDSQPDREIKLRTVLDNASKRIEGRFQDRPLVEASLRETLGETYATLGDYAPAELHLQRAVALRREQLGLDDPLTLTSMDKLADLLGSEGKNAEAEAVCLEALGADRRLFGPDGPQTINELVTLVFVYKAEGKLAEAEQVGQKAVEMSRRVLGPDADTTRSALNNLSSIYWVEGKLKEAEQLNAEALEAFKRAEGPDHPDTLVVMSNLASVYWTEGRLDEAEKLNVRLLQIRRRVLGPNHPDTVRSMHNLATTYRDEGRFSEASALEEQALAIRMHMMGPAHADTLSTMIQLALDRMDEGKLDEAQKLATQTLEADRRVLGPAHFQTLATTFAVVQIYRAAGRLAEAEAMCSRLVDAYNRASGHREAQARRTMDLLGQIRLQMGRYADAENALRPALAFRATTSPDDWATYYTRGQLGASLAGQKRYAEAEPLLVDALAGLRRNLNRIPAANRKVVPETEAGLARIHSH